jgi:hypothetical protein
MSEKIEIPAEKLHEEMLKLRQGKHMDFLRSLTGMDWGEEGELKNAILFCLVEYPPVAAVVRE